MASEQTAAIAPTPAPAPAPAPEPSARRSFALATGNSEEANQQPLYAPSTPKLVNKRRMSMQDTIDVSKLDRHMYTDRVVSCRPSFFLIAIT